MREVPLVAWIREAWPFRGQAEKMVRDYSSIGLQHREFLADVALRGGVFRNHDPASDGTIERFNGRRELALEIIKICNIPAPDLYACIPTKPREENR